MLTPSGREPFKEKSVDALAPTPEAASAALSSEKTQQNDMSAGALADEVFSDFSIPPLDDFVKAFPAGRVDRNGVPNRMRLAMHFARGMVIAAESGDMECAAIWMTALHRATAAGGSS